MFRSKRQCGAHWHQRSCRRNRFHDVVIVIIDHRTAGQGCGHCAPSHFEPWCLHSHEHTTGFVPVCQWNVNSPRERRNASVRIDPQ